MASNELDIKDFLANTLDYTSENGLVLCDNPDRKHIGEWLHITERAKKLEAKAVLFRRYYDIEGKNIINSKPSVYIFEDEELLDLNGGKFTKLHAKIWSAGEADVYMIVGKTNLTIINARRPENVKDSDLENLKLWSGKLQEFNDQRFSAHIFGKGMFWEQGSWELDENHTPFQILLNELEKTRAKLETKYTLSAEKKALDKVLLLCILIMFLEEKKSKKEGDEEVFALKKIFEKYGVLSFVEILKAEQHGKLFIQFLKELANKYNGKIFDILTKDEETFIQSIQLVEIALFAEGKVDAETNQISIWKNYNFDYLPIELISSIYENFLQSEAKNQKKDTEKGVVYTPPFLVNFLIDEVMPLNLPKDFYLKNGKISYKVLDPSCGSGIFLVAAYKRLLDWWFINNYDKVKKISQEEISDVFKQILEDNIFGVDINETATQISIFSLTIAFLDKIDPKLLWEDFKFKNLSAKNIKHKNFFEWASTAPKDFDLVIGNPPFNVPNGTKSKDHFKTIEPFKKSLCFEYVETIPDNFAFYFLEFAKQLSPQKKVCLIIPSTLLLYSPQNTSINYRKALFENSNVEKIYDFTHLRRLLFKRNNASSNTNSKKKTKKESDEKNGAEPAVCAIILNNSEPKFTKIEHTVIKRLVSTEKKMRFEIDHYDRHFVRFDWACRYPFVWKCNLLGGGRLFHLIYRLSLLQNLNDFIKERQKENSEWIFEVGYEIGNAQNGHFIEYLYNQDKVHSINDNEIIISELKELSKYFYRPTKASFQNKEKLFTLPILLIHQKTGDNLLPIAIKENHSNNHLVFTRNYVGIHAPKDAFETLRKIYNRLQEHRETYMLWALVNSSSALISQETSINKIDLETFPFPDFTKEEEEYLELTEIEKILRYDVLEHYKHLGKGIEKGEHGYEPLERKLNVSNSTDLVEILHKFGDAFCNNLNQIYAKNGNSWQRGKIYQTKSEDKVSEGFIIYQFGFGLTTSEIETIKVDESYLKNLIFDEESNRGAIWVRVGRVYEHTPNGYDCVFLIKPANIRYWLRSVALRDADKTFMDLKKAGF